MGRAMNSENSEQRQEAMLPTLVLTLPEDKLARIREGELVIVMVDGLSIPARKHAGQLVQALMGKPGHESSVGLDPQAAVRPPAGSLRAALAERLANLIDRFTDETITEALSQDDVGTFTTLSSVQAWEGRYTSETDKARLRGVRVCEDLIERAGGTLRAGVVAKMLGVSEEAIRKRLRTRTLIGIKSGRAYRIPAVQFQNGQEVAGLRDVLRVMPVESPWMRLNWLMSPEPRMGDRVPIEMLREGKETLKVIEAAQLYGEQGGA